MAERTSRSLFAAFSILACLAVTWTVGCGGDPSADDDTATLQDGMIGDDIALPDEGNSDADDRPDAAATDDGNPEDTALPEDTATQADAVGEDMTVLPVECQPDPSTPVIRVSVYNDANASSKTDLLQTITAVDGPLARIPVSMIAPATGAGETCDMGWYYFGPDSGETFTDGVRVLKIDAPDCRITSHNMARRTPAALAEGHLKMLVLGDSIPKRGTAEGTFFFDNVAAYFDGFGDITVQNVAFSGSTSSQWLPATLNFKNKVEPNLADSDVVFVSLGGNDIMNYAADHYNQGLDVLMEGITDTIASVENNLLEIFSAIRAGNPDADIVWLVYPNYADSDKWRATTGQYADLVKSYFDEQMYGILEWAAGIDGLILVDLFDRMSKEELDACLFDELHYNADGHRILGDELLKVLNGVKVEGGVPVIGGDRFIGVNCDE